MAGCKTDFLCTLLPEWKNQCFWCSESLDFPWEACPQPPPLLCTKKQFYPTNLYAKFACHHINKPIKNNMVVLTRYTIQCSKYFVSLLLFEAPTVCLTFSFFCFFNVSLYQTRSVLCLWPFKMCSSHFFFILSPSLRLSFFLFFLFSWGGGGEGWRRLSQLIWYTRGGQPQIISYEQGGHHIQQELPIKFHHLLEKKWTIPNQKFI